VSVNNGGKGNTHLPFFIFHLPFFIVVSQVARLEHAAMANEKNQWKMVTEPVNPSTCIEKQTRYSEQDS